MKQHLLSLAPWLAAGILNLSGAAEWPEWRGPGGQGHATVSGLPAHWSESRNVAWKTLIPGRGWSSPVIDGDQIWMTTAIETPASAEDTARRLKANTGDQPLMVLEKAEYRAVCVDRRSGRVVRDISLFTEREPQWVHKLNSYASPTPVIEPGRLYAHFGASGTVCLDTRAGKVLWTALKDGGGMNGSAFSSPVAARVAGKEQVLVQTRTKLAGIDKATGAELWTKEIPSFRGMNILTPTVRGDTIFTSAYGAKTYLFTVNKAADGTFSVKETWSLPMDASGSRAIPRRNSSFSIQCRRRSKSRSIPAPPAAIGSR